MTGNKAYIGHMGLAPEGCLLRLEILNPSAHRAIGSLDSPKLPGLPWTHVFFVHVPFGSLLLIDASQFHGGHYGTNDTFRFHCVFANFDWGSEPDRDFLVYHYLLIEPHKHHSAESAGPAYFSAGSNQANFDPAMCKVQSGLLQRP